MAIGGLFWLPGCVVPPLLTAVGRVRLTLRAQAINQAVAVAGVFLAAMHGIEAVAAAAIAISAIHAFTWTLHLRTVVPFRPTDIRAWGASTVGVTGISLLLPVLAALTVANLSPALTLLVGLSGLGAGWLAGVAVIRHPISVEILWVAQRLAGAMPWAAPGLRYPRSSP
jgi:O-antigen/teichoic acid export membrane protein